MRLFELLYAIVHRLLVLRDKAIGSPTPTWSSHGCLEGLLLLNLRGNHLTYFNPADPPKARAETPFFLFSSVIVPHARLLASFLGVRMDA